MRLRSLLLVAAVLMVETPFAAAVQSVEPWLPIAPQDLQVKAVPGSPGAPAIQLYLSYYQDDNDDFISAYRRIKILTEAGKKYADREILLKPGASLKELRARTIHPDGSMVEFQGKPFLKTIIKARGIKYQAATFTFPDVTTGSIVEYSCLISLPRHTVSVISEWPVQSEIYTVKERLRFRAYQGIVRMPTEWGAVAPKTDVAYSYLNMAEGSAIPQKKKGNLMELELENVAAFDGEEYMPPEDDYKPAVLFYYGGREAASPDKFWQEWQRLIAEYLVKFVGNSGAVRDAAIQAMGGETDPEKKLRKLYARAQQIRNLSYERERTREEEKGENLKRNNSAQDVLQHGYGTNWEIDGLFVAMTRAAGFEATLLGVSDRHERSFTKIVLWLGQLSGDAALVKLNGKELVLDPGTRFCPYGMLRWRYAAVPALNYTAGGDFVTTPAPEPSLLHRTVRITVAADGSAEGEITVELHAQEALEHRLDALETDEEGRRKTFEDEVQAWLPNRAVVKMIESQGWDATDEPLIAKFSVAIPSLASIAGKRMVIPAYFLPTLQKGMFTREYRRYPIVFPYPFTETDQVTIRLPDGYSMEVPPYRRKAGLSYASYEISSGLEQRQLVTNRSLRFDGLSFPPEKYVELKSFFSIVLAGDGGQAVLQTGPASSAEKHE
ncbi:MAG TPA: DUF3857 domain-containing protein [Candidatus Angelobacter sp.]